MAEDRAALSEHYRAMRRELASAFAGLSDAQLLDASLDGWSVVDHLAHIAMWDEIRAAEVRRISAGQGSAWRMSGDQDNVFNELSYELRRQFTVEQARWELQQTETALLDALAAATDRGLDASLYGEAGLISHHATEHAGWIRRWRNEKGYSH